MTQVQESIIGQEGNFIGIKNGVFIAGKNSNSVVGDGFVQVILGDDISSFEGEDNKDKLIITGVEGLKMIIGDTILGVKCNLKQIIEDAIAGKNKSIY